MPSSTSSTDGHTPRRTVRVPDEVWDAAKRQAMLRNEDVSKAIVRFLQEYARPGVAPGAGPVRLASPPGPARRF